VVVGTDIPPNHTHDVVQETDITHPVFVDEIVPHPVWLQNETGKSYGYWEVRAQFPSAGIIW
jgi:hypothetical protein